VSTRRLSSIDAIRLVAGREIAAKLTSRTFWAITAVLVTVVASTVLLFHVLQHRHSAAPQVTIGVTAQTDALRQPLTHVGSAAGLPVRTAVVDPATGTRQVRDGDLAALVVARPGGGLTVVARQPLPSLLQTELQALSRKSALDRQIVALGGNPATVQQTVDRAAVTTELVSGADAHRGIQAGVAGAVGVLTYIMLLISIQLTGQGVVEEKANRIVELLLATVRPWELLTGKVLGIGAATMAQVAALGLTGGGVALATGALHMSAAALGGVIGWAMVWYVLGYFLYALVIAAAAALVSRQEDLAAVAVPVSMLVIAAYLVGQIVVPANPHGAAAAVLSETPLFSPVVMPMRAVYGVPGWQTALALGLMTLALGATARSAGAVYRHAILLTGSRVTLRAALGIVAAELGSQRLRAWWRACSSWRLRVRFERRSLEIAADAGGPALPTELCSSCGLALTGEIE
jgi:ABC-2 type transport system permease protein